MKKKFCETVEKGRVQLGAFSSNPGERCGAFEFWSPSFRTQKILVIASCAEEWGTFFTSSPAWDHVSVSQKFRCPTWEEMAWVKELFFDPEELVIQFHPPKSQYVNHHKYCLHLWKPQGVEIPLPPREAIA